MTDVAVVADVALPSGLEGEGWDEHAPYDWEALAGHLDTAATILAKYVAFPTVEARDAAALWAVHCHCLDAFESTPRLAALSAEKGSGKTRLLEVLDLLVPAPMHTVNMSAAALFRTVEDKQPTILMDECDTYLAPRVAKDHEELRGLVNAGHRRGAVAYRCVIAGKTVNVKEYPAFAAVALAGIGDLPDTILDRSIVIAMKRRRGDELVAQFRQRHATHETAPIRAALEQWAKQNVAELEGLAVEMPAGIIDRAADVWEPLIMLGAAAGADWLHRANRACLELNAQRQQRDPSLGILLLTDVRTILTERGVDKIHTDQLIEALHALDESPWSDLRGKPLDARGLARRLRAYEVRPSDVRIGDRVAKGYTVEWFHDAWGRYLPPPSIPETSATRATAATVDDEEPF